MNLPKTITRSSQYTCVLDDERNKPALFTANDYDSDELFKDEVCKRYNSYNKLVIALVFVSTFLVFAVMTIVNLYRFKLV